MADANFTSRFLNINGELLSPPVITNISTGDTRISGVSGLFYYKLTALNGGETSGSTESGYTWSVIGNSGSGASVHFNLINGATDYRLYRSGNGHNDYILVGQNTGSPIIDRNDVPDSGYFIPSLNTTNAKARGIGSFYQTFYSGDKKVLLKEFALTNSHENTIYYYINLVPSGEPTGIGNAFVYNDSLDAYETKFFSINSIIEPGDKIVAKVSAGEIGDIPGYTAINFRITGIEIT